MNASEFFEFLEGLHGSRVAGAGEGISRSCLLNGIEYALAEDGDERRLRSV